MHLKFVLTSCLFLSTAAHAQSDKPDWPSIKQGNLDLYVCASIIPHLGVPERYPDSAVISSCSKLIHIVEQKHRDHDRRVANFYFGRATAYGHIGDWKDALPDLDRVVQLFPDDKEFRQARANVASKLNPPSNKPDNTAQNPAAKPDSNVAAHPAINQDVKKADTVKGTNVQQCKLLTGLADLCTNKHSQASARTKACGKLFDGVSPYLFAADISQGLKGQSLLNDDERLSDAIYDVADQCQSHDDASIKQFAYQAYQDLAAKAGVSVTSVHDLPGSTSCAHYAKTRADVCHSRPKDDSSCGAMITVFHPLLESIDREAGSQGKRTIFSGPPEKAPHQFKGTPENEYALNLAVAMGVAADECADRKSGTFEDAAKATYPAILKEVVKSNP